jgi:hypothetical protein
MALGNESGDMLGLIREKKQRSKISWDYPFKYLKDISTLKCRSFKEQEDLSKLIY